MAGEQADLIVMGSRVLGAFKQIVLGSVSNKCCKTPNVPR
ncbi:universal stress protein [Effusibacillus pohliae]|nr:universal stress protein [Effusibacillus pohliae]